MTTGEEALDIVLVIACKAILYRVGGALSRAGHSSRSVLALFENSAAMLWPERPTLTSETIIFAQNVHLVANTLGIERKPVGSHFDGQFHTGNLTLSYTRSLQRRAFCQTRSVA